MTTAPLATLTPCPAWCVGHSEMPDCVGDRLHSQFWNGIVELSASDSEPAPLIYVAAPTNRPADPRGGDYSLDEAEEIARDILAAVATARSAVAGTNASWAQYRSIRNPPVTPHPGVSLARVTGGVATLPRRTLSP